MADPILKTYGTQAAQHFERAAAGLALRQVGVGAARGNVVPWPGSADLDFHGTLAAIWIWARHEGLSGDGRFAPNMQAGWTFIETVWRSFIPEAIGPHASDEAAYDCAMVLRAALGDRALGRGGEDPRAGLVAGAARVLGAYLTELHDLSGRDFQDPGFLAWNLIEYARVVEDRGLLATGRRFVEQAFGMKAPPAFASEPDGTGGLFDFSSTTATRVLAIVASEGNTPFVGAWLRERVAGAVPPGFVTRARDEACWNGCVAALAGRAYVISTEKSFLDGYRAIRAELERRVAVSETSETGTSANDTLAVFYHALAADALVRTDAGGGEALARGAHARR